MTLEKSLNRVHSKIYYHNRIGKKSVKTNLYKINKETAKWFGHITFQDSY